MSYVHNYSRGAWENANFWQRMNPAAMAHSPTIRYYDAMDVAFAQHSQNATTATESVPDRHWPSDIPKHLPRRESPCMARIWAEPENFMRLVLVDLLRAKIVRIEQPIPF